MKVLAMRARFADARDTAWGAVMAVVFVLCCLCALPFVWLAGLLRALYLDLADRGSSNGVVRVYSGWGTGNPSGGPHWGLPARERRNLRAWCREHQMPLGQMEADVKAYFAGIES